MPGIPVIRFPGFVPAVGYTDFARVYVSTSIPDVEAKTVLKHERAHVYLQHLTRGQALARELGSLNRRLWNVATDMEIAVHIYSEDDERVVTSRAYLIGRMGAVSKADAAKYPECLYAEEFYEALLRDGDDGLQSHDGKANDAATPGDTPDGENSGQSGGQSGGQSDGRGDGQGDGQKEGQGDGQSNGQGDGKRQGNARGGNRGSRGGQGNNLSERQGGDAADADKQAGTGRASAGDDTGTGSADPNRSSVRSLIEAARSAVKIDAAADEAAAATRVAMERQPTLAGVLDAYLGRSKVDREASYRRPSRRESPDFIRKGMASVRKSPKVNIYVDRSGSFTPDKTARAEEALAKILVKYRSTIDRDVKYFADEVHTADLHRRGLSGGTNYAAVWADIHRDRPEVAVVITDDDPCPDLEPVRGWTPTVVVIHIGGGRSAFGAKAGAQIFSVLGEQM